MYQSHFGLSKKPFSSLPDPAFLYKSPEHARALAVLEHAVLRDAGVTVLTGDTGCGKTTLIRHLINNQPASTNIGLVSLLRPDGDILLPWILYAFGLDYETKGEVAQYDLLLNHLVDSYQEGKRSVLIVDEAHAMQDGSLEEIRMISNLNVDDHPLISIILVGHSRLHDRLTSPSLAMLYQRVAAHCHLGPLPGDECGRYINARMRIAGGNSAVFTAKAVDAVAVASNGVPRVINSMCESALLRACTRGENTVTHDVVETIVRHRATDGGHGHEIVAHSIDDASQMQAPQTLVNDEPSDTKNVVAQLDPPEPENSLSEQGNSRVTQIDASNEPLRMWLEDVSEPTPGSKSTETMPIDDVVAATDAPVTQAAPAAEAETKKPVKPSRNKPKLVEIESPRSLVRNAATLVHHNTDTGRPASLQDEKTTPSRVSVTHLKSATKTRQQSNSNNDQMRVQLKLLLDSHHDNSAAVRVVRELTQCGFRVLNHKTQFRQRKRQLTLKVLVNWFGDATQIAPVVGKIAGIKSVLDIRFPQSDSADELLARPQQSPDTTAPGRAQRQSLFGPEPF